MSLLPLRDGNKIPQIGLGTFLSKEHEVGDAVGIFLFFLLSTLNRPMIRSNAP